MEPEHIENYYSVRAVNPITGKHFTTRWKMTETAAASYFEGQEYEILWGTKEERRVGGDPAVNAVSRFHTGTPGME